MAEITQKLGFEASSAITTLKELQKAISGVNRQIRSMQKLTSAGTLPITQSFQQLRNQAIAADQSLRNTRKQMEDTGRSGKKAGDEITVSWETMVRVVTTQVLVRALNTLIQGFGDTADAAHDFQIEVARIATITPGGNIEAISNELRELAVELGRPVSEVTAAAYQALQNDLGSTAETMEVLSGASHDLSLVTGSDLTDSVNSISSILKAYHLDASEAADITDTFFVAIDKGRITLDEISDKLGTVSPLAATLGVDFQETAAAVAALTTSGLDSSTAMTQLRNVLQKMIKPGKDLQAAFDRLGVSGGQDLIERFGGLQGALEALRKEFGGNEQAVAKAFGTIRGQLGVLNLLANEGGEFTRVLEAMEGRAGRAADAVSLIDGTDAREADRALAAVNDTLLSVGETAQRLRTRGLQAFEILVPDIGDFFESVSEIEAERKAAIERGKKLSEQQQKQETALLKQGVEARKKIIQEEIDALDAGLGGAYSRLISSASEANTRIGNEAEGAIDVFVDARKQAIEQIEQAIKSIDDRIEDSSERVIDAFRDLDDFRFEKGLKGLGAQEEATKRLERAQRTAAAAREAFAKAGVDEEAQRHARELQQLAERQQQEASRAAERTDVARLEERASRQEENLLKQRLDGEQFLRSNLANFRKNEAQAALKDAEERFAKEEELTRRLLELDRQRFAPGATADQRAQVESEIADVQEQLLNQLAKDSDNRLFEALGVQDFIDRTTVNLVTSLDRAEVNWTNAANALQTTLDQQRFKAVVDLVAQRDALAGEEQAGIDQAAQTQAANAAKAQIQASQEALAQFLPEALDVGLIGQFGEEFSTFAAGVRELFGEAGAVRDVLATDPYFRVAKALAEIGTQAATANQQQIGQQEQLLALQARNFEAAKQELSLSQEQDQAFQGAFNAVDAILEARKKELQAAQKAPEAARQTEQALQNTAAAAQTTADTIGTQIPKASQSAANSITGIQNPINSIDASPAIAQMNALAAAAERALAAASRAASAGGALPAFHGRSIPHFAEGGSTRGRDTVPAMLSPGEFVINARSSRNFSAQLQAINAGQQPAFREEGGSVTNIGDIHIHQTSTGNATVDARQIARELSREIRRGTVKLN